MMKWADRIPSLSYLNSKPAMYKFVHAVDYNLPHYNARVMSLVSAHSFKHISVEISCDKFTIVSRLSRVETGLCTTPLKFVKTVVSHTDS